MVNLLKLIVTPDNEIVRSYELSGEQELMFAIQKLIKKENKSPDEVKAMTERFLSWDK